MKQIHVEASTFCNARCPLCPRSLYGYKVDGVHKELHLDPKVFEKVLEDYPEREYVYFNGNLGDPMMHPSILELVKLNKLTEMKLIIIMSLADTLGLSLLLPNGKN